MRVLYFMNHVDQGGAALALYDLIIELKKIHDDYYPIVVTGKKNRLNEMLNEIGVENYFAEFKNFMSSYKRPFFLTKIALLVRYEIGKYRGIKQIEDVIDFKRIDIIHSNLERIDIGAILAAKYGIVHFWHIREHAAIYSGFISHKVVTTRKVDFNLISVKENPIKYMNDFDLMSVKDNYFIAISESVKREWVQKGLSQDKIILVYDGIREELYNGTFGKKEKNCRYSNNNILNMVFLGGYCKEKGQEEFIKALLQLPSEKQALVHVDFFGNGEEGYITHIKELAKHLLKKDVISINSYEPNISSKLHGYDVGINCSEAEGFGRVTVEYMMAGLCSLVSNTGANPEIIDDKLNGVMYMKNNVDDLKNKILFLLDNPKVCREYGFVARVKAINEFSMRKHAKTIYELYKNA